MSYLVLALQSNRKAYNIIAELPTLAAAEAVGEQTNTPDYVTLDRAQLGKREGPELVTVHNALVPKEQCTERFSTKDAGVRRVLAAWDAAAQVMGDGKHNPKFLDQRAKPEAKAPKKQKTPPANGSLLRLHAAPAGKRWQKGSARSRAWAWLTGHAGPEECVEMEEALTALSQALSLSRAVCRGLLDKLHGVGLLTVEGKSPE